MSDQTLTEWCAWLRTDLAYRAPELWPGTVLRWLDKTEERFGERTPAPLRTWAARLDDDNEAPRDLTLVDPDGHEWTWSDESGWSQRDAVRFDGEPDGHDWAAALFEARALREVAASASGAGEKPDA